MAEAVDRISEVRRVLSSRFPKYLYVKSRVVPREASGIPPTGPERFNRRSVGIVKLVGPMQSAAGGLEGGLLALC
jgi:hypothetical protein